MAKQLIPEELNELIQEYLTDGVLTDKERQVILKRAEKMGLDRDEIDLYLDAQVQKIDQAADAVVRRTKSKSCPYCGAPIPQLTDKCPECGQFITPQASEELQEIFDKLESALIDLKSAKDISYNKAIVERYARKAKTYYANNPKVQKILAEVGKETVEAEIKIKSQRRSEAVKAFFSNPWTYGGLFIILTILIIVFFIIKITTLKDDPDSLEPLFWAEGGIIIGIASIVGTVTFIKKVCLKM